MLRAPHEPSPIARLTSPWHATTLLPAALLSLGVGACLGWPIAVTAAVLGLAAFHQRKLLRAAALLAACVIGLASLPFERRYGVAFGLIKIHRHSPQSECRTNLKSFAIAEESFFTDHQRYSEHPSDIGFEVERGNRYSYALSERLQFVTARYPLVDDGGTAYRATRKTVEDEALLRSGFAFLAGGVKVGVMGQCPACEFTAICVANLDRDDVLDIWSISSADRKTGDGEFIGQGDPHCESNDLED